MQAILYIHGFNSTGNAYKAQRLKEFFPDYKIVAPTLDYYNDTPEMLISQLEHEIAANDIKIIVGTSLGGMLTMYMSARCKKKALAINPASEQNLSLQKFVGSELTNYVTGEKHVLSQRAFDSYQQFLREEFANLTFDKSLLTFALAKDDELLGSYVALKAKFTEFDVHEFSSVGHRFLHFEYLEPIIRKILNE